MKNFKEQFEDIYKREQNWLQNLPHVEGITHGIKWACSFYAEDDMIFKNFYDWKFHFPEIQYHYELLFGNEWENKTDAIVEMLWDEAAISNQKSYQKIYSEFGKEYEILALNMYANDEKFRNYYKERVVHRMKRENHPILEIDGNPFYDIVHKLHIYMENLLK